MLSVFRDLFTWMPQPLAILVVTAFVVFAVICLVQIIKLVIDVMKMIFDVFGGLFRKVVDLFR